jgi:ribonucleoside-diphosphate reductase beta chain
LAVFNANNNGYETGKYPLFLGEDLGLFDTVNCAYPVLEDLYQKQVSQIWNENEISLIQDKQDMLALPKDTVDLMVKTISWQHLGDSIASKSIAGLLMRYVSNSELEGLLNVWSFFETIHARAYSHIIKQTFVDPNQLLRDTYNSVESLIRSEAIVEAFNQLENLPVDATVEQKREAIALAFTALFALEAIAFMSSFAVTFAITETGAFQGIGQEVTLIARDEVLHTRMDYAILSILKQSPEWVGTFAKLAPQIKDVLDSVVRQELRWANYLFSEGRQVIGLTAELLQEYTLYMAKPLYEALGVQFDFTLIEKNPCSYMDKYIDSTKIQVAAQELQITSYKIGSVKDDTENLDLDFDF